MQLSPYVNSSSDTTWTFSPYLSPWGWKLWRSSGGALGPTPLRLPCTYQWVQVSPGAVQPFPEEQSLVCSASGCPEGSPASILLLMELLPFKAAGSVSVTQLVTSCSPSVPEAVHLTPQGQLWGKGAHFHLCLPAVWLLKLQPWPSPCPIRWNKEMFLCLLVELLYYFLLSE